MIVILNTFSEYTRFEGCTCIIDDFKACLETEFICKQSNANVFRELFRNEIWSGSHFSILTIYSSLCCCAIINNIGPLNTTLGWKLNPMPTCVWNIEYWTSNQQTITNTQNINFSHWYYQENDYHKNLKRSFYHNVLELLTIIGIYLTMYVPKSWNYHPIDISSGSPLES